MVARRDWDSNPGSSGCMVSLYPDYESIVCLSYMFYMDGDTMAKAGFQDGPWCAPNGSVLINITI